MSKRPILAGSPDDTAYGHLLPVLEAELSWGNRCRGGFTWTAQDGGWFADLDRPLHVDRLREVFEFPEHIVVSQDARGRTSVLDRRRWVGLSAAPASGRLGPARPARRGLLRRILGP